MLNLKSELLISIAQTISKCTENPDLMKFNAHRLNVWNSSFNFLDIMLEKPLEIVGKKIEGTGIQYKFSNYNVYKLWSVTVSF